MDVIILGNTIMAVIMWSLLFFMLYLKKYHGYFQRRNTPHDGKIRLGFFTILFIIAFFPLSLFLFIGKEI